MDTFEAIKTRRSVREYSDEPVPKDMIEKILDCGRLAPTARGEEPWEFVVVTGKSALKSLADITDHGKFIAQAPCAIAVFCRETKYYLEDGCAATENILIACASLGMGSCWVAGDKKPYCQKVIDELNVPSGFKLVSIISLGYPAKAGLPSRKRPVKDMIHWEKY